MKRLERDAHFTREYAGWVGGTRPYLMARLKSMIPEIMSNARNLLGALPADVREGKPCTLFEEPAASILLILPDDRIINRDDLAFLHEYIKDRILDTGLYLLMQADERSTPAGHIIQRYHLKSDYRRVDSKNRWIQGWGTVTVELYLGREKTPLFVKVQCARVKDRMLTEPADFRSFLEWVFT